jgi:DNA-binding XRE family transcriptional regulator
MNLKYLNDRIAISRIPIVALAELVGISRQSLYLKMKGEREFKTSEVTKLCEVLRLTDEERNLVFFADEVDKTVNVSVTSA